MRVKIEGDHSSYHGGSAAAFNVIKKEVMRAGEITEHEKNYDLLVVNGEGSMHHNSGGFRRKIRKIQSAINNGKKVVLVNSVWQDNPKESASILRSCDQVVVREVLSQRELDNQGIKAQIFIDQSYHEFIDESASFIDYKGGVVFTDFWSKDFECFAKLTSKWAQKFHYLDMQTMSWSSIVRSLQTASLLVTGRHHAVYAACKAEIPFLAMQGNTHKIEGLIETAGVDLPIYSNFKDIKECVVKSIIHDDACQRLFQWMRSQSPWQLELRD